MFVLDGDKIIRQPASISGWGAVAVVLHPTGFLIHHTVRTTGSKYDRVPHVAERSNSLNGTNYGGNILVQIRLTEIVENLFAALWFYILSRIPRSVKALQCQRVSVVLVVPSQPLRTQISEYAIYIANDFRMGSFVWAKRDDMYSRPRPA